ncbi:DUF2207 domain-containing protein [bacterium]|nr:DUF2207 domain-containing protein [bacterium]
MKRVLLLLLLVFCAFPFYANAQTEEHIEEFRVKIEVRKDSSILVEEQIKYFFPSLQHGIYRYLPYHYREPSRWRSFNLEYNFLEVKQDGSSVPYELFRQKGNWVLKIGDPLRLIEGSHTYLIRYQVKYALRYFSDHDELYWNVTGSWSVPVSGVYVEVDLPEVKAEELEGKCYPRKKVSQCNVKVEDGRVSFVADDFITIAVKWPKGVVQEVERPYHLLLPVIHFYYESPWFLLLIPLAFVICFFVWWRYGRDLPLRKSIAPEFEIPEDLSPAEMGIVLDEKASNREIVATLVDLAVRGYLKIKAKKGSWGKTEFIFSKTNKPLSGLRDYEKKILEAILGDRSSVSLSELKKKGEEIFPVLEEAKEKMYSAVAKKGYFYGSPAKVRSRYQLIGGLLVLLGLVPLAMRIWERGSTFLTLGLWGAGLIVIFWAKFMPRKTPKGREIYRRILGFRLYMTRAEKYRSQWQEKENMLTKFLPYAVLFGITTRWLQRLKDLGLPVEEEMQKVGFAWSPSQFRSLGEVVDNLPYAFSASLPSSDSSSSSLSSSGFSSSGGFGGGFGGGGGGSW